MSISGVAMSQATEEQIEEFSIRVHRVLCECLADQYGFQNPKITITDSETGALNYKNY